MQPVVIAGCYHLVVCQTVVVVAVAVEFVARVSELGAAGIHAELMQTHPFDPLCDRPNNLE